MKDKTRMILQSSLVALILIGLLVFAIPLYLDGKILLSGLTILMAIFIFAFFYFVHVKKSYRDVEKGIPLEDERSKGLRQKASAISFNLSLYWTLGLMWYTMISSDFFGIKPISTERMIMLILLGMLIIFALTYLIIKRKEER